MKRIGISLLVSVMLLNTTAFAREFSNQDFMFGKENTDELEKSESDVDTETDDSTQLDETDSSLDVEDDKVQETPSVEEEENRDDESVEEELTVENEESIENIEKEEELERPKDSFDKLSETVIEDGWYSICPASNHNLCLDVEGYSEADGANIQLIGMKQNFAQRFYIFQKENGWYGIQNVASNKMLGVAQEGDIRISQYTDSDQSTQEFKFYEDENRRLIIRSNNEDVKVLDVVNGSIKQGGKLQLYKYNKTEAQKFYLKRWKKMGEMVDVEEGIYRIYPSNSPQFSLDVKGGSISNKANIQLYTKNDSAAQEWEIVKNGSWYKIISVKSGKALDITGKSEKPKTNLQQYDVAKVTNQSFRFYKAGEGEYFIVSKYGTVIDCANGKYAKGNNVWLYSWNGSAAQKWSFEKVVVSSSLERDILQGYYHIEFASNNRRMSIEQKSVEKGANIQLNDKTNTDDQVFKVEKQSDGWYMIKNQMSGKYLDVENGSAEIGANLQQYTKNKSNAQKFRFFDAGSGQYYIKSKLSTFIEAEDEGNVFMNSAEKSVRQKWILRKTIPLSNEISIKEGDYNIISGVGSDKVLDIRDGSVATGAKVQIYTRNGTPAQSFHIKKENDGWYRIKNNKSKMYLSIKDGNSLAKANLIQEPLHSTGKMQEAQKFKFYNTEDGKVYIVSKFGTVVDVQNAQNKSGANVQMYRFNNSNAQKWKLEKAVNRPVAHWKYVGGYKLYYDANGKLVKDVSKIIGKQSSYWIKVNKKKNVVTVYAKDGNNGYIIPVKAFICSGGTGTPTGTFSTSEKYRWKVLMGPSWGQWSTRITGSILFHSVYYNSPNNNNTLSVSAYNKLGTTASHGCIRLTAGDAKWIYDNCKIGTKVTIYNSNNPGPFGKPTAYKLSSKHTWDPTDPNMAYKCKKKGCH